MDDNEKGTKVVQWPEAVPTTIFRGGGGQRKWREVLSYFMRMAIISCSLDLFWPYPLTFLAFSNIILLTLDVHAC